MRLWSRFHSSSMNNNKDGKTKVTLERYDNRQEKRRSEMKNELKWSEEMGAAIKQRQYNLQQLRKGYVTNLSRSIHISLYMTIHIYFDHVYQSRFVHIYIYIYIYTSSSSSSCRAPSTDIPDPLSPLLPIVHRLWQVFRAISRILT